MDSEARSTWLDPGRASLPEWWSMSIVHRDRGISFGTTLRLRTLAVSFAVALFVLIPEVARAQEEEVDYTRSGFYVGLSVLMATEESLEDRRGDQAREAVEGFNETVSGLRGPDPQCQVLPVAEFPCTALTSRANTDDAHAGINARIGYRMHPFFAVEIQAEYVPNFDAKIVVEDGQKRVFARLKDDHDLFTTTANLKLILPTGRLQLFGLAGFGLFHNTSRDLRLRHVDPPTGVELNQSFGDDSGFEFVVRTGGGADFYITEQVIMNIEASYVIPFGRFDHLDYLTLGIGFRYQF